jgi:hypothetical protein
VQSSVAIYTFILPTTAYEHEKQYAVAGKIKVYIVVFQILCLDNQDINSRIVAMSREVFVVTSFVFLCSVSASYSLLSS